MNYIMIYDNDPKYTLKEHISATWQPITKISGLDWADADLEAAKILEREGNE